ERLLDASDGRALLADRDVDAAQLLGLVARLPVGFLVEDRVDAQRRLAGLAVTDGELALPASDRRHGVDGLDAGLHGLLSRVALQHGGGLQLERAGGRGLDLPETVDRLAERVDRAAEEPVTDGDGEDLARRARRQLQGD